MRTPSDVGHEAVGHDEAVAVETGRPGERREETIMIDRTDLDLRYADHAARVARVDREGWLREEALPIGERRPRGMAAAIELMRRQIGAALIRAGERLQGTLAAESARPAAARYTRDAIRYTRDAIR